MFLDHVLATVFNVITFCGVVIVQVLVYQANETTGLVFITLTLSDSRLQRLRTLRQQRSPLLE